MKKTLSLEDKICIYGNHFFLLSDSCYGCYHFNYVCGGPECGSCPAGEFAFDKYQAYAEYVLYEHLEGKNYLLGRLFGINLEKHLDKLRQSLSRQTEERHILAYKEMIGDVEKALEVSDDEIDKLKKEFHIESDLEELDLIIENLMKSGIIKTQPEDFTESESEDFTESVSDMASVFKEYDDIPL